MRISETKINGIKNPLGFSFPRVSCSWKVTDTESKKQAYAKITVARDAGMETVICEKEGSALSSIGEMLEVSLEPRTRYYYRVEVTGDAGDTAESEIAWFETGKMKEAWSAKLIGQQEGDDFHPVFVKEFSLPAEAVRARIYVTGVGLYEAYLNGKKIGSDILAPFFNDYRFGIQYQTYDITDLLQSENKIELSLGNGWFKGRLGYEGARAVYGDQFAAIAELHFDYANGRHAVIGTDESWKYFGSDTELSDIYDGECCNRLLWENQCNELKPVRIAEEEKEDIVRRGNLTERYSVPVTEKEELPVREVIHSPKGETILDFGQNFAGYVCVYGKEMRLRRGMKLTLDFGEILQEGNFYNENYRTAKAQYVYVSDGREEEIRPHFTYFGFRYVRVTLQEKDGEGNWTEAAEACGDIDYKTCFVGKAVYSDLDVTAEFHCSDEKLNRLAENCMWGQKSNFLDMPTDCPQRDERLGWTGDAQVFAPTACINMDARAFFGKFLRDLRADQKRNGGVIPNYIPNFAKGPSGSSVWGDVATFLPMTLYEAYGDLGVLKDAYPMMKDWVDFIIRGDEEHGNRHLWDFGFHFGDWLAQDGVTAQSMKGGTDDFFVASVYYYASLKKTAEAAELLGEKEDAAFYGARAAEVYEAILGEYVTANGRLAVDTQTAYLLCLRFGIYREKDRIIEGFRLRLKKDCYKIKGGFVGATTMCQVMAEHGLEDLAYYMLFQEGFPGWMHCVNLGATTVWERWNSVLDDGSISGTGMNSLNHYAYGSVMEYVYRYIGGIRPTAPGYRSVLISPQVNPRLTKVRYAYHSVSGTYVSEWEIKRDGSLFVHAKVPFGCHAELHLPGTEETVSLGAGVFEKTYRTARDYRKRYTMDTRLEELQYDEEAMKILKEDLPLAYAHIEAQDAEEMSLSLEELRTFYFLGFNPSMVDHAAQKLLALSVFSR